MLHDGHTWTHALAGYCKILWQSRNRDKSRTKLLLQRISWLPANIVHETPDLESEHYIRQLSDIQIRCAPAQKIIVKGDGDVRRWKYVFLFM